MKSKREGTLRASLAFVDKEKITVNIVHLMAAAESLDEAITFTINPKDREETAIARDMVLALLRKHGVFVGCKNQSANPPPRDAWFRRILRRIFR